MADESYTLSDAASVLGVSIPTLRRMIAQKRISAFRTPGGHLRITAESVSRYQSGANSPASPGPSPVLANRRERIEELTLEAQELRARHEIERLRRDNDEEERERTAEIEADERAAERAAEAQRLRLERVRTQRARLEQENQEAERLAAWRSKWLEKAMDNLPGWLTPAQRKEAIRVIEAEISKRRPECERIMDRVTQDTITEYIAPLESERTTREVRERATMQALTGLPWACTDTERANAKAAIRKALENLPANAEEFEIYATANEAVRPMKQVAEKRSLDERLIEWAIRELPYWGRTEKDEAHLRRECTEILSELPADASEAEAKEELEPIIRQARRQIEERQARKEREDQKANLIQKGVAEVTHYLWRLKQDGEISTEDYWDSDLKAELQAAVRNELEAELSGLETTKEAEELAREIIDDELDCEVAEEEDDEEY
ncbi:MAG TPA: helix-turn-helix domain-containing protein [Terriglobia bacterium]|nr:helix-turn-helix domain-containing protein [Terriglobia bacterium]